MDYGTTIADMHDGWVVAWQQIGRAFPENKWEVSEAQTLRLSGGSELIQKNIRQKLEDESYQYLNKMLVVIDETARGGVVLAASVDDRLLHFITVNPF